METPTTQNEKAAAEVADAMPRKARRTLAEDMASLPKAAEKHMAQDKAEDMAERPEAAAKRMAQENQKLRMQLHEQTQKIQQMEQQLYLAKQAMTDLKGTAFDTQQTLLGILKKSEAYAEAMSKQLQTNNNSLTELAALVINVAETPTSSEIEAAVAAKQLREQAIALVNKYQIKRTGHEEANH